MNKIIKIFSLFLIITLVSYLTAEYIGNFYVSIFPQLNGLIPSRSQYLIIGLPLAYIFFLTLLFTAFGDSKKYWWIGILLLPALAFELYFDLSHIYVPIILGLVGWGIGYIVAKLLAQYRNSAV